MRFLLRCAIMQRTGNARPYRVFVTQTGIRSFSGLTGRPEAVPYSPLSCDSSARCAGTIPRSPIGFTTLRSVTEVDRATTQSVVYRVPSTAPLYTRGPRRKMSCGRNMEGCRDDHRSSVPLPRRTCNARPYGISGSVDREARRESCPSPSLCKGGWMPKADGRVVKKIRTPGTARRGF